MSEWSSGFVDGLTEKGMPLPCSSVVLDLLDFKGVVVERVLDLLHFKGFALVRVYDHWHAEC